MQQKMEACVLCRQETKSTYKKAPLLVSWSSWPAEQRGVTIGATMYCHIIWCLGLAYQITSVPPLTLAGSFKGDAYYTTFLRGRPVGQAEDGYICASAPRMDCDLATASPRHALKLTKRLCTSLKKINQEAMYVVPEFHLFIDIMIFHELILLSDEGQEETRLEVRMCYILHMKE
jgi:hypothetical protein